MKANKTIYRISFLASCGLLVGAVSIVKQYLIDHEMYSTSGKFILAIVLFLSIYFLYRWFGKRIDSIGK